MATANLYAGTTGPFPEEWSALLLAGKDLRLARIASWGQASPPGFWYDQDEDEWVALLAGRARLLLAEPDETLALEPGDHLLLPAHRRHRVDWTAPGEATVWLALFLPAGSARTA